MDLISSFVEAIPTSGVAWIFFLKKEGEGSNYDYISKIVLKALKWMNRF